MDKKYIKPKLTLDNFISNYQNMHRNLPTYQRTEALIAELAVAIKNELDKIKEEYGWK